MTALIVIGVPGVRIHTIHHVSESRRTKEADRSWKALRLAEAKLDELRASGIESEATRDAEQSLNTAMNAFDQAVGQPPFVPDWLRIPAGIGLFLSFWGVPVVAFRKDTS